MYVIGLLQITDYTIAGNQARGRLIFTRENGNNAVCTIFYDLSTSYNTTNVKFGYLKLGSGGNEISPCTFTYNGKKWAGFTMTSPSNYSSGVQVMRVGLRIGEKSTPFLLRYKTSNTGTINNSEVNNSLVTNGSGLVETGVSTGTFYGNLSGNATSAGNADLLDGFHGSAESTANTYVRRNQNKYISVNYINSDTAKNENHDFTQIITTDDGDNYYRKAGIRFFMKRLNSYTKTIDLRSLDANKYYPISFQLVQRKSFIRIKIWNCLDGNKPTWATHKDGFAVAIEWDTTVNGWGAQDTQRIIYADNYKYCDKSPCGGIEQNTMASVEIVYLRGGAIYYYNNNDNIEAIINSNGYSWTSSTYSYSAPVINNIKNRAYSCYNLSLRSFSTLYCSEIISYRLNISSTSTFAGKATFNGGLSGTLTGSLSGNASSASTATKLTNTRTIWGQSFNGTANVSGSLTGVASITASGNITAAGAITAKSSSSDIRLKKNIKQYNALDIIHKLKSVKYYWNDTAKANSPIFNDNEEHYGLIAQDLLINGYSQWVSNCFKDYYVIQYERLIPVLWRGIQQVDNEVATLKKKIATLEKELSSVKRQLSL